MFILFFLDEIDRLEQKIHIIFHLLLAGSHCFHCSYNYENFSGCNTCSNFSMFISKSCILHYSCPFHFCTLEKKLSFFLYFLYCCLLDKLPALEHEAAESFAHLLINCGALQDDVRGNLFVCLKFSSEVLAQMFQTPY